MYIDNIGELDVKLYKNGLMVVCKPMFGGDAERKVVQSTKRKYTIKKSRLRSACIDLWKRKKCKSLLFVTFTFPVMVDECQAARCWDRMLNNLRNNYDVANFVWVKEVQKNGNYHYHILLDRNYINIKKIQQTWANVCFNALGIPHCFANSVRLGRKPVVTNVKKVANYLSKYMAKDDSGIVFYRRVCGYNNELEVCRWLDYDEAVYLWQKYKFVEVVNDSFYNVYSIKNFYDLPEYWSGFVE